MANLIHATLVSALMFCCLSAQTNLENSTKMVCDDSTRQGNSLMQTKVRTNVLTKLNPKFPKVSPAAMGECAPHFFGGWAGPEETDDGRLYACAQCAASTFPNGSARPHLLYLHLEHTGGSSLECATVDTLYAQGLWSNLGHMGAATIQRCMKECFFDTPPKTVMTIRDPYHYWKGQYLYLWYGGHKETHEQVKQLSFSEFVASKLGASEAARIWGRRFETDQLPDYILHTDTLQHDWVAFLEEQGLPPIALPHVNSAASKLDEKPDAPPRVVFTKEVVSVIDERERRVFDTFGYQRREAPFELD